MLDLTKPVRFKKDEHENAQVLTVYKSEVTGRIIVEVKLPAHPAPLQVGYVKESDLENIPEPKVKEQIMAVCWNNEGDFFFSEWLPGCIHQKVKITYTEGAENPWRIEEIKP